MVVIVAVDRIEVAVVVVDPIGAIQLAQGIGAPLLDPVEITSLCPS